MKILEVIKIDYKAGTIITQLHKYQNISIKIKENKREAAFRKGVKKACNVSPLVFNIYIEEAINECKVIAQELKWTEWECRW